MIINRTKCGTIKMLIIMLIILSLVSCNSLDRENTPLPGITTITLPATQLILPAETSTSVKATDIPNHPTMTVTPTILTTQSLNVPFDPNDSDPWLPQLIRPLDSAGEYIILTANESDQNSSRVLVAVDSSTQETFIVAKGEGLIPRGYSPSRRAYLFQAGPSIYMANNTISEIWKIFQAPENVSMTVDWLTDEVLLLQFFDDIILPPSRYVLYINSAELVQMVLEGNYFIQNVFPLEEKWALIEWGVDQKAYMVGLSAEPKEILDGFSVEINPYLRGSVFWTPETNEILIFGKNQSDQSSITGFYGVSDNNESSRIIMVREDNTSLDDYSLSQDGRYFGYVQSSEGADAYNFQYYDLRTDQLSQVWELLNVAPITYLIWSPDSSSIVVTYGSRSEGIQGFQVYNVPTGTIRLLKSSETFTQLGLDENVMVVEWVKLNP